MDTAQHHSSLVVYHHLQHPPLSQFPPHPSSNSTPRQPSPYNMSWNPFTIPHNIPNLSQDSAFDHHGHDHPNYTITSTQQSFVSRHVPESSTNRPQLSSVDPGPSSHSASFDAPQIENSIGPDRGLSRRRVRVPQRVPSHGELPEYTAISQSYGHSPNAQFLPRQGSRPQSPAYQHPDQSNASISGVDTYNQRLENAPRAEWQFLQQSQSRSTSGSAASASSNPRSTSPALSVASALTSVSSSASNAQPPINPKFKTPFPNGNRQNKKKRLYNTDRRQICEYAANHQGMKQEDIAAIFGVERSTVSKILKQKARWLHVDPHEKICVAKLRPSKFPELEYRLENWVKEASQNGKTLTDSVLRQKARQMGDELGFTADKFKASSGWLENFKHRHGIRRGVWYGHGTLEAKYRAYGTDFIPTEPEPYIPFPDTPVESEDEGDDQNGMGPQASSSLALQPPWPQAATHDGPSTADEYYHSGQLQYPQEAPSVPLPEPEQPAPEAMLPPMEPIAIQDPNGQQVMVAPQLPEMVVQEPPPTFQEAERALDKVIIYVDSNLDQLDLSTEDTKVLMGIKYKLFGKATGREYDLPYLQRRCES